MKKHYLRSTQKKIRRNQFSNFINLNPENCLLALSRQIGLPPHTPVAQKIAGQRKTDLDIKTH